MATYKFESGEGSDKLHLLLTSKAAKALEKSIRKAMDEGGHWVVAVGKLSQDEAPKAKSSSRRSSRKA